MSITDKRLWRLLIVGSVISMAFFLLGSIAIWGLNLFIVIGLVIGVIIGLGKTHFSAIILSGLLHKEASSTSVTLLNLIFYFLSWGVILFLFILAYKITLFLLIAMAAGIIIIPLVLTVYGVLKGAGIIKYEI